MGQKQCWQGPTKAQSQRGSISYQGKLSAHIVVGTWATEERQSWHGKNEVEGPGLWPSTRDFRAETPGGVWG